MKKEKHILWAAMLTLLTATVLIFNFEHTRSFLLKSLGRQHTRLAATPYVLSSQTQSRINHAIVLYMGNPNTLTEGKQVLIDAANPKVVPFFKNSQEYAPVKFIAEKLGAQVSWNAQAATMTIVRGTDKIMLTAGQEKITLNGSVLQLASPIILQNNHVFIRVDVLAYVLGHRADYYGNVVIISPKIQQTFDTEKQLIYDLIYYFNSKSKAADVHLNRVTNDRGSFDFTINFSFQATDACQHPSRPYLYLVDKINKKVHLLNLITLQKKSVTLPYGPERIEYYNDEIFVTQVKQQHSPYIFEDHQGGLAILNAETLSIKDEWDLGMDPFDIAIDTKGFIYIRSGSGQWSDMRSYDRKTKKAIENLSYVYARANIAAHPYLDRIYSKTTELVPDRMSASIVSNGYFTGSHGPSSTSGYLVEGDFELTPDGKFIYNDYGTVLALSENPKEDMAYMAILGKKEGYSNALFSDFAFDLENKFCYASFQNFIYRYGYSDYNKLSEYRTKKFAKHLFYRDSMIIAVSDNDIQLLNSGFRSTSAANSESGIVLNPEAGIKDIAFSSGYAKEAITVLADQGIISGDAFGYFNPKQNTTRAQMIKVLVGALDIDTSGILDTPTFIDVPKTHWAYPYVEAGYREGIINGVTPDQFGVNGTCTREQMAVMLTRALGLTDDSVISAENLTPLDAFTDKSQISSWARKSIGFTVTNKIMNGTGENTFSPRTTANREQMASVIYRFLNNKASISKNIESLLANRKIKLFLNRDELYLNSFRVRHIDPVVNPHEHSLIREGDEILAPAILFGFLESEYSENFETQSVHLERVADSFRSIKLKGGSANAYVNLNAEDPFSNEEQYKNNLLRLPTAPKMINSHLYVPLRTVVEALGAEAEWNQRLYAVVIRDIYSSLNPNLKYLPYEFDSLKSDYTLKMTISFKDSSGKELGRLEQNAEGILDSGSYSGRVRLKTTGSASSAYNSESEYEVSKFMNTGGGFEYYVKDLENNIGSRYLLQQLKEKELLLTDIDYIRSITARLAVNFQNSDSVKRRTDLKLDGQPVDQYIVELFDSPSIAELFDVRTFPRIEQLKSIYEGSILMDTDDAYRIERFKLEKYTSKEGLPVKDVIAYSGSKYRRDVNYDYMQSRKGSPLLETYVPFEVDIEMNYYNIEAEAVE